LGRVFYRRLPHSDRTSPSIFLDHYSHASALGRGKNPSIAAPKKHHRHHREYRYVSNPTKVPLSRDLARLHRRRFRKPSVAKAGPDGTSRANRPSDLPYPAVEHHHRRNDRSTTNDRRATNAQSRRQQTGKDHHHRSLAAGRFSNHES